MKKINQWIVVVGTVVSFASPAWVISLTSPAWSATRSFSDYTCQTGIVYKTVNGEALDMALIYPTVKKYEKAPFVVFIHGGGWSKGSKTGVFSPPQGAALKTLTDNGIACATIEYRFTRPGISTAYDCVVDCKDAVRFLIKHADEYGLDPTRITTWGGSAGGHLCLMTALAPNDRFLGDLELQGLVPKFCGVVSCFPATTFLVPEIYNQSNFKNPGKWMSFLGGPREENDELAALLSPTEHLRADSPPVLLIHGDKDQVLSYDNSTYMRDLGKKIGAEVELITVTNGLHSFIGDITPSMSEINQATADFMIKNLTTH